MLNISLAVCLATVCGDRARSQDLPTDEEIRQLLADRIAVQQKSVGMVVGIITPKAGAWYGRLNQGDTRPLDGDTVFEIGSVTKIFTALLLAGMVQHGEVLLDNPVTKYLPPAVHVPERNGRPITLRDSGNPDIGAAVLFPRTFHSTTRLLTWLRNTRRAALRVPLLVDSNA
jgi:CubicO group peptidase (beta-lactamase class C family)